MEMIYISVSPGTCIYCDRAGIRSNNRTTFRPPSAVGGRDRIWSTEYIIPKEGYAATVPLLRAFNVLPCHAHAYCFAHGIVNVLKDLVSFLMDRNKKTYTARMRREEPNASKFPGLLPRRDGRLPPVPWKHTSSNVVRQWEEMVQYALVARDQDDGRLKSIVPTISGGTKTEVRKGLKFVHCFAYIGPLGDFFLNFLFPPTPQRELCHKLIDFMKRGLATEFNEAELRSLDRKGAELENEVVRP